MMRAPVFGRTSPAILKFRFAEPFSKDGCESVNVTDRERLARPLLRFDRTSAGWYDRWNSAAERFAYDHAVCFSPRGMHEKVGAHPNHVKCVAFS